jgi:hypothetical protein
MIIIWIMRESVVHLLKLHIQDLLLNIKFIMETCIDHIEYVHQYYTKIVLKSSLILLDSTNSSSDNFSIEG